MVDVKYKRVSWVPALASPLPLGAAAAPPPAWLIPGHRDGPGHEPADRPHPVITRRGLWPRSSEPRACTAHARNPASKTTGLPRVDRARPDGTVEAPASAHRPALETPMSTRTPGRRASRRRLRALLPCCALVTVAGVAQPGATSASAASGSISGHSGRYIVRDLKVLSGPTPFPDGCPGAAQDDAHIAGAEIEPAVTVDPRHPGTIVATWQQDLGFGGRSDLIGTSRDGGRTWSRRTIPGLTRCTGGTADSASDPWVAAGGDGTIYFTRAAISLATDPPVGTNVMLASRKSNDMRCRLRS